MAPHSLSGPGQLALPAEAWLAAWVFPLCYRAGHDVRMWWCPVSAARGSRLAEACSRACSAIGRTTLEGLSAGLAWDLGYLGFRLGYPQSGRRMPRCALRWHVARRQPAETQPGIAPTPLGILTVCRSNRHWAPATTLHSSKGPRRLSDPSTLGPYRNQADRDESA